MENRVSEMLVTQRKKKFVFNSPFIVGGPGCHTWKALFQKPPTTI